MEDLKSERLNGLEQMEHGVLRDRVRSGAPVSI